MLDQVAAPGTREVDPTVEEVRVALALNGGVSLAVWMGGCAVELDRARRTSHGGSDGTVYQALCDAFRRELVVDVMSGTSAGGINGALLAAALAKGVALAPDFLRDRWLKLGDFSKLLQPLGTRGPASLMQGEFFARELEKAFDELCRGEKVTEPLIPALDITTTDIAGRPLKFVDTWGQPLLAREYRARFKFRHANDFEPHALAHAARASASFPLAFEPYAVPYDASALANLGGGAHVVDGGLLDNAPIRAAIGLIPSRAATRQVRRLLCYVNGDPAVEEEKEQSQAGPTTAEVIGVMVDLPRKAPFADQLADLQAVTRNSGMALGAEHDLLKTTLGALTDVATLLLPTYRRRRRLRALQYGLDDPAQVEVAYEAVEDDVEKRGTHDVDVDLPWLRETLAPDPDRDAWRWGIDAARRVHQLALDVIRDALPGSDAGLRRDVLEHRVGIDDRVRALDRARAAAFDMTRAAFEKLRPGVNVGVALEDLATQVDRDSGWIASDIAATAKSLLHIMQKATEPEPKELAEGLFGAGWATGDLTEDTHRDFLRRVLAVEIVRRSFTDDDVVQNTHKIAFAQLTPEAPAPLFSAKPFSGPANASVSAKLCGAILGHFGAFYRRAWRANDFMWGRMDAAARITEMIVGVTRTRHLREKDQHEPWDVLATALAAGGTAQRAVLEEALADLGSPDSSSDLESRLRNVLEADLTAGTGEHTRVICTRAAQFEILTEELRHVVSEATDDVTLGSSQDTLGLDGLDLEQSDAVYEALERLRKAKCVLPVALGRNRGEITTDLAVRTIAHAGLISLGVSRGAGGVALSPLTALRSFLLPVSGATALHWASRLGVVAAFGAASLYLGARIAGTNDARVVDANQLSFLELLLAVVSLLVVLGTAAVPAVRALLGRGRRRWLWLALALPLLACGGIAGSIIAAWPGPLGWAHLVVAPGVEPPWYVTLPALALGAGAAVTGPRPLRTRLQELTAAPWTGTWSLLLVFASFAVIAVWSAEPLWNAVTKGEAWQVAAALLAVAGILVAFVTVVVLPPRLTRRR
jgi:patatin-related protein